MNIISEGNLEIRVNYDGLIMYGFPANVKVSCTFEVSQFPYDLQSCAFDMTSGSYLSHEMTVQSTNVYISNNDSAGIE
jgi:hypothetical protein